MHSIILTALVLLFSAAFGFAQSTPLNQPVAEGMVTAITCELSQAPRLSEIPGCKTTQEAEQTKGTYHYKLWVPSGYAAERQKRWPCMFIMSPGGNAGMGKMQDYLQSHGFVVVMLVEAKNGDLKPIVGNFLAAHDDVTKRLRIQEGKKYATGLSGGGRGSSLFVQIRPGFCGLIMQGAGTDYDEKTGEYRTAGIKRNPSVYVAMTMGKTDSNKVEIERMKKLLPAYRFASFEFDGGHEWAPSEVFQNAMNWIKTNVEKPGAAPAGSNSFDDFFKKK